MIGTRNKGTVTRSTDFGRTPVSDIFRGELRSRLQREGDHSTDVMQPFFTLQLNIEVSEFVIGIEIDSIEADSRDAISFCFHNNVLFQFQINVNRIRFSNVTESDLGERGIREFCE